MAKAETAVPVPGDKAAFDEWREARRKRALQIVLGVIIGWNLLFIPLGIYMWPRAAQPTMSPVTVFFSDLSGPTDRPAVVDNPEQAPAPVSPADELSRLLSQFDSDAIERLDMAQIMASAQRQMDEERYEAAVTVILDGVNRLSAGERQVAPELLRALEMWVKHAEDDGQSSNDDFELSDIGFKVTEQTDQAWRFEYRFSITNKTDEDRTLACSVKFLDEAGFVIGEAFELSTFPAGRKQTARGSTLIELPHARRVVNVEVIASPR